MMLQSRGIERLTLRTLAKPSKATGGETERKENVQESGLDGDAYQRENCDRVAARANGKVCILVVMFVLETAAHITCSRQSLELQSAFDEKTQHCIRCGQ